MSSTLTLASFAVMMTFLATKVGHEETLRAFRVTFTSSQLPSSRAADALISARTAASHTAKVTFGTSTQVTIISENIKGFVTRQSNRIFNVLLYL